MENGQVESKRLEAGEKQEGLATKAMTMCIIQKKIIKREKARESEQSQKVYN